MFKAFYYEAGKSVLKSKSHNQIKNIALMLKSFSSSSIKIGGYTANPPDTVLNYQLSNARGFESKKIDEAVGNALTTRFCPANDTPDYKAKNRV